jgi:RNA polymerase-binding transcription factor DksA
MTPPPNAEQIQRLKRQLLDKGAEINAKLMDILDHKRVDVSELIGGGKPGERPEERLRRFLDLVDGRLRAIRQGTYGRCERCGDGLPYEHLRQVPWIDTCQKCAVPPEDREN